MKWKKNPKFVDNVFLESSFNVYYKRYLPVDDLNLRMSFFYYY